MRKEQRGIFQYTHRVQLHHNLFCPERTFDHRKLRQTVLGLIPFGPNEWFLSESQGYPLSPLKNTDTLFEYITTDSQSSLLFQVHYFCFMSIVLLWQARIIFLVLLRATGSQNKVSKLNIQFPKDNFLPQSAEMWKPSCNRTNSAKALQKNLASEGEKRKLRNSYIRVTMESPGLKWKSYQEQLRTLESDNLH